MRDESHLAWYDEQRNTPVTASINTTTNVASFGPPAPAALYDWCLPPPEMDYVLPGLLAGTVGAIVSPGGAGKSMLALQMAISIAGGVDLLDLNVKRGQVVYLPAEDPNIALHHRFYAIAGHCSSEQMQVLYGTLAIYPVIGRDPDIFTENWFNWIYSLLDGKRVLFLDTLRRFHKRDENSGSDMAEAVARMETMAWETGCSIVFLHHASKAAAMSGLGDQQQASRGSSVLVDNIRWQMYVAGMSEKEAKDLEVDAALRKSFVRAGVSKQNYGPPVADMWLRRLDGGVLVPAESSTSYVTSKRSTQRKEVNDEKW